MEKKSREAFICKNHIIIMEFSLLRDVVMMGMEWYLWNASTSSYISLQI
jgi:hypothetical protein